MKASRGEIKICDILDAAGLEYKEEFIFDDLISSNGRPLRFDFCVFDDDGEIDFLIEYQGIQHYEKKSAFGGAQGLARQKFNDRKKSPPALPSSRKPLPHPGAPPAGQCGPAEPWTRTGSPPIPAQGQGG